MKLTAIVNAEGKVVGTYRLAANAPEGFGMAMVPMPGCTVHEVDVADDCQKMGAEELHEYVRATLIRTRSAPQAG